MESLSLSGLASGFDWKSLIDQLSKIDRVPQNRLRVEQSSVLSRSSALSSLVTELKNLQTKAKALSESGLYSALKGTSSDPSSLGASVSQSTPAGSYQFNVSKLATYSQWKGGADAGRGLDPNADITSNASGFAHQVTQGTFTVNNSQISVEAGDSLNDVLSKIQSSVPGVTASYNSTTDKVELTDGNGQAIMLGSATDTSNFLQVARLSNNGSDQIQSSLQLGGISLSDTLGSARFNTPLTDGTFKINGVAFSYNSSDTVSGVLQRINQSNAGVVASYDSVNDKFSLANTATGDLGIALEDVSGNFLQATKIASSAGGTLVAGENAEYSINGGATLTSQTNTLGETSHGIQGLSVTALKLTSDATVSVANDPASIKKALTEFVDQYNKVQSMIDTQTASSTDAKGVVSAGVLAGNREVSDLAQNLRSRMLGEVGGNGLLSRLSSLGFTSDGYSNKISLSDPSTLDKALSSSLDSVSKLFSDSGNGIAKRLDTYLESVAGLDGALVKHQDSLLAQSTRIDSQVAKMEERVLANRQRLTDNFVRMEQMIAQINNSSQFLLKRFA